MNPESRPRTLTWTVFIALIPVALVLVLLLGVTNYYAARGQILDAVDREISILATQSADNLSFFFRRRHEDALVVAEAPLIRDYLKNLDYGLKEEAETYRKDLAAYFDRFAERSGVYERIDYYDADGRLRASGGPAAGKGEGGPAAGPRRLEPGRVVMESRTGTVADRIRAYSAGVFDADRQPRGTVVLTWSLDRLTGLLERARVGREGRVCLVDAGGYEFLVSGTAFEGAITAAARVSGTEYTLRLMAKPEEFLKSLNRLLLWIIALSLVAALVVLFWTGFSIRKTVRPIEEMAEGTKRLAAGDLDYRFAPPPIRELRTLGDAFNEMAVRLKERNEELKGRIRELTALREVDAAVSRRLEEEPVLRTCLKAVVEGLAFDRAGLYWVDNAGGVIAGRFVHGPASLGPDEAAFRKRRVTLGEADILNEVVRSREALLVKDPAQEARLNAEFVKESRTPEFVVAPICGKDRVFGVISADTAQSRRSLGESDRESLTMFANAVGLALENAMLIDDLAASEARNRAVLENSPVAVLGLSEEHWITTWNRGAEELFGYAQREVVGKPVTMLFEQEQSSETSLLLAGLMEKGSVREYAMGGRHKSGRRLDISVSWGGAYPDFWMNREWTVVIRDVGEAKRLQRQLVHSEKLSAVGQLISGIAHELNSPLHAILGYARFASEETGASSELIEDVRRINESATRCRKIIDNLLTFVRQGEVRKEPLRLKDAVDSSLQLLHHRLRKEGSIEVAVRLPARLPRVTGDLQQVEQVFVNLINNACDALGHAGGRKTIAISAAAVGGFVRVEVRDDGPGIAPDARPRVFEPFFTTKGESQGTGLGLPTCRQIVTDHGGHIGVDCPPEGGTVFWFTLPVSRGRRRRQEGSAGVPRSPSGARVLVVEDDPDLLALYLRLLRKEGFLPAGAATLEKAFRAAAESDFDLVLADLQVGSESGLALFDGWPTRSRRRRPPLLLVTGQMMDERTARAVRERGLRHLNKPAAPEDLLQAVWELLARKAA